MKSGFLTRRELYRPSESPVGIPFGLRSVGRYRIAGSFQASRRVIDFVQLLWCVNGKGLVRIEGKDHGLTRGQVAIYMPGSEHFYYTEGGVWEIRWFSIDGLAAPVLAKGFNLDLSKPFKVGRCPEDKFKKLERGIRRIDPVGERQASLQVYDLLLHIKARLKDTAGSKDNNIPAKKILNAINRNSSDPLVGVKQVSYALGIDASTLSRRFKSAFGISPKEYINSLRLQNILTLLRGTSLPVAEISRRAGFSDPNYMAKFFHKKMGMSPSQFRTLSE